MRYKNAFNCKRCPQTNTEDGCPAWWEFVEVNRDTGEQRVTKGCRHEIEARYVADISSRLDRLTTHVSQLEGKVESRMQQGEDLALLIEVARRRARLLMGREGDPDVRELLALGQGEATRRERTEEGDER